MAVTPTPAPLPVPPPPTWSDAASIAAYATSILAGVLAVVTLLHPGFTEPAAVQTAVPSVAAVIAGVVQLVNIITHRSVQKAAIQAHATIHASGFVA